MLVRHRRVVRYSVTGKQPRRGRFPGFLFQPGHKSVPVVDDLVVQIGPVVQPGAFEKPVGELEPHRAHQPQFRAQANARASDRAGVVRDFRFKKNDM